MAFAKPDLLNLELEAEMLRRVGSSIARVKKRVLDTTVALEMKPPETETLEIAKWEEKVSGLINFSDSMSFPKLLDFKRQVAKMHLDKQEAHAAQRNEYDKQQAEREQKGREAKNKLNRLREGKVFGETMYFGGAVTGQPIKTIENYEGLNTIYGGPNSTSRTLVRKDGRFTNYDQASQLPPWLSAGTYPNADPAFLRDQTDGSYRIAFTSKASSRQLQAVTGNDLRAARIERRDRLESWLNRDLGPRYCHTPASHSREWAASKRQFLERPDVAAAREEAISRGSRRNTPLIILGDMTRQGRLVEVEEKMRGRGRGSGRQSSSRSRSRSRSLSPSHEHEHEHEHEEEEEEEDKEGKRRPSPAELRVSEQSKFRYSYLHQSQALSAKLERAARIEANHPDFAVTRLLSEAGGGWQGRKDYTLGALSSASSPPLGQARAATITSPTLASPDDPASLLLLAGIDTDTPYQAPIAHTEGGPHHAHASASLDTTDSDPDLLRDAPSIFDLLRSPIARNKQLTLAAGVGNAKDGNGGDEGDEALKRTARGEGEARTRRKGPAVESRVTKALKAAALARAGDEAKRVQEKRQRRREDSTGILRSPLRSPLGPVIRRSRLLHAVPSEEGLSVASSLREFVTSRDVNIRGLLLEEQSGFDRRTYRPPNVSPLEREAILRPYASSSLVLATDEHDDDEYSLGPLL
jgi:hypothetical protein